VRRRATFVPQPDTRLVTRDEARENCGVCEVGVGSQER
jgi:hypothetical protein